MQQKKEIGILVLDIDQGNPVSIEDQVAMIHDDLGTEREWCAIGVNDEDGFAEVVALAHPTNARVLVDRYNNFNKIVEALESVLKDWKDAHCTEISCRQREKVLIHSYRRLKEVLTKTKE